ncbi:MAG: glycosyltransferase family 2 protein [Opitutaceae bacterium]|nr:glycosyltransferase family 2 protein [Opitutaceae bacterium]
MVNPPPISVVIVARNEAHNLPRCLASVQGWVAETVVVLNYTTDASEAIAAAAGAIVFQTEWRGYRDTKNWALGQARQPWALCLDADEEVSPALRASILDFFATDGHQRCSGARFPRKVWFIDRWILHGDWYPDYSLRLIRRDQAKWGGDPFVHEKMEVNGPVATLRGDLHHYSFPTLSSQVGKFNTFSDLFLEQAKARGERFSLVAAVFRPFWRFFRAYVLKCGFLDGYPGFYIAWATAFGAFVRYSRLYEHEKKTEPRCNADARG